MLLRSDLPYAGVFRDIYLFYGRYGLIGKRYRLPLQVFLTDSDRPAILET